MTTEDEPTELPALNDKPWYPELQISQNQPNSEDPELKTVQRNLDLAQSESSVSNLDQTADNQSLLEAFQDKPKPSLPRNGISLPTRPLMRREGSVPAPRQPPPDPPPAAPDRSTDVIDSLSLQQVRALTKELPQLGVESASYAFVYQDAASLPEELEEWFSYHIEERARIAKTHSSYAQAWGPWNHLTFAQGSGIGSSVHDWTQAAPEQQQNFIQSQIDGLTHEDLEKRLGHLETLVYLAMGCWFETSGIPHQNPLPQHDEDDTGPNLNRIREAQYKTFGSQLQWIQRNTIKIFTSRGFQPLLNILKSSLDRECNLMDIRPDVTAIQRETEQREMWCAATLVYISLEVIRTNQDKNEHIEYRAELLNAKPNLLLYLGDVLNRLRWAAEEDHLILLVKILLLSWKASLVLLGGLDDLAQVKESFDLTDPARNRTAKPVITASPLDYHSFRQEITSKYPAYIPPKGSFSLEPDQKSLLPALRNNPPRTASGSVPINATQHGGSIIHQPVHIATPAPSPPPSPAAGKGGKKQNYQTNQLFPFLYPPLGPQSNQLGGRGTTFLQDSLVSKTWEGSDIPISILEASELFSSRIRSTRSLQQLYEERVEFSRHERGWIDSGDNDVELLDLNDEEDNDNIVNGDVEPLAKGSAPESSKPKPRLLDGSPQDRLERVEDFYRDGLPHLQSMVVVVLKTILHSLASIMTNPNNPLARPEFFENVTHTAHANAEQPARSFSFDPSSLSIDELEQLRTQETTAKAASGFLLMILKWFKISHILKFEYLCQLLVDANYVPIILKLLQSQEMERAVHCKSDRAELNFFTYCLNISRNKPSTPPPTQDNNTADPLSDSSEDEALPPPIKRRRSDATKQPASSPPPPPPASTNSNAVPEVDELGIPVSELPSTPIANFSWRNLFSSINFLRILQKVCKNKAHRNLMLVQYKSATYLKKSLRIPQDELRLYTLKLFKNQVPYCGRKWRQSNMRVITAVYLHCRPELRDDWLLSADVDNDVDQAVPMEQSLRALTHYYNLKHFAKQLGAAPDILAEQDFFQKELDRMEWGEVMEYREEEFGELDQHQQQGQSAQQQPIQWESLGFVNS